MAASSYSVGYKVSEDKDFQSRAAVIYRLIVSAFANPLLDDHVTMDILLPLLTSTPQDEFQIHAYSILLDLYTQMDSESTAAQAKPCSAARTPEVAR